jgi:hypothetical protein
MEPGCTPVVIDIENSVEVDICVDFLNIRLKDGVYACTDQINKITIPNVYSDPKTAMESFYTPFYFTSPELAVVVRLSSRNFALSTTRGVLCYVPSFLDLVLHTWPPFTLLLIYPNISPQTPCPLGLATQ